MVKTSVEKAEKSVHGKITDRIEGAQYIDYLKNELKHHILEVSMTQANLSGMAMKKETIKATEEISTKKVSALERKLTKSPGVGAAKKKKGGPRKSILETSSQHETNTFNT